MKRILMFFLAAALLAGLTALAAGGGDDPAVALSYLDQVFTPALKKDYVRRAGDGLGAAYRDSLRALADERAAVRLAAKKAQAGVARKTVGTLVLKRGDTLTALPGLRLSVKYGALAPGAGLSDITHGAAVPSGQALSRETLYMAGTETALRVSSAACEVTVNGVYRLAPSDAPDYGSLADVLAALGLFRGAGERVGYNLEEGVNRAQGLVMFLRVLGLEDEALAYAGPCPFTDVPANHWARSCIAYAYDKGLTDGTGSGRFTPDGAVTCQQYATFLLRALHYAEGEGKEFSYKTAVSDLTKLGLVSSGEAASLSTGTFARYQMVYLSYCALFGVDQDSGRLLMNQLVRSGAVEAGALPAALALASGGPIS